MCGRINVLKDVYYDHRRGLGWASGLSIRFQQVYSTQVKLLKKLFLEGVNFIHSDAPCCTHDGV